jgi:hypothetical protein
MIRCVDTPPVPSELVASILVPGGMPKSHPLPCKRNGFHCRSHHVRSAAPPDRNEIVLVFAFCSFLMKADSGEAG